MVGDWQCVRIRCGGVGLKLFNAVLFGFDSAKPLDLLMNLSELTLDFGLLRGRFSESTEII